MDVRGFLVLPALLGGFFVWMLSQRRQRPASGQASMEPITIELGGLRLTVLRRHAPSASNAWCRNALLTDASCVADQRELRARGSLLSAVDLQAWHGKLPAFLAGERTELHLCADGDCVGLHMQRPVRDDMAAVTVVLLDPQNYNGQERQDDACRRQHSLLFLVTPQQLEWFLAGLERAMQGFPVYLGHAVSQPA